MKQILAILVLLGSMSLMACAQGSKKQTMKTASETHVLVAYFSATGTTAAVAEKLAQATGGKLYAIEPVQRYTTADLDWHNKKSRSSQEMDNPSVRPAMKGKADVSGCEVVFVGYPIWWGVAPRIINTFLENHDLKGKRIIPFATSGGSGIGQSVKALKQAYPDLQWSDGRLLNRAGEEDVRRWVDSLGL